MSKSTGRHGEQRPRRWKLCGVALTPANVLGMVLFGFFISTLFSASPFESFNHPRRMGGSGESLEDWAGRMWRGSGKYMDVPRDSHAYLKAAFPGARPDSFIANVSRLYEPAAQELAAEESPYAQFIEQDLAPWQAGITRDLVEAAAQLYDTCDGDMMRLQILNGSLWVHHVTDRRNGWYPAVLGPKNVAAKGRVPYAILALLDALRLFPGQIPDVDLVLHTADFACVKKSWDHGGGPPLPMLGLQGSSRHYDLPFPDYTFWGHEHQYLQDPWGNPAQGWAAQAAVLGRKYENVSLLERIPQAMWRGRTQDKLYPYRDALRRRFVQCPEELQRAGRAGEAALFSLFTPPVALQDTCDYRYQVYIESDAYASNLKQKMICGSVLVALRMQYHEWWSRALVPGQHFVEVTHEEDHVCEQATEGLRDMNAMFAARGPSALPNTSAPTPTLAKRLKELRSDRQLAPLLSAYTAGGASGALGRAGGPDSAPPAEPAPGVGGNYSWGSAAMPWEVAAAGQEFVRDHVRMQDALAYIRDLLRAYAARQQFKVRPAPKSRCYTGDLLLEQFGTPFRQDAETVATAYPWLRGYDAGCKEAEAKWGAF